jgi:hypothetical protein
MPLLLGLLIGLIGSWLALGISAAVLIAEMHHEAKMSAIWSGRRQAEKERDAILARTLEIDGRDEFLAVCAEYGLGFEAEGAR